LSIRHLQQSQSPYNLLQPTQSVISVQCFPRPRQCLSALWVINVSTELFSDTLHLKQLSTIIPGEGHTKKLHVQFTDVLPRLCVLVWPGTLPGHIQYISSDTALWNYRGTFRSRTLCTRGRSPGM